MEEQLAILEEQIQYDSIYKEFAQQYVKYANEYNTDKFIFFMQVGSFYENYSWEMKDENFYLFNKQSKKTASILNMIRSYKTSKKPHTYNNPRMYGFPDKSRERHLERLLEEDYTIVLIGQRDGPGKKKIRDVVERFTSGTNTNNKHDDNYVMTLVINEYKNKKKYCGISLVNINANDNYFFECSDSDYDPNCVINNIVKIILTYQPVEYLIYNLSNIDETILVNLLNIANEKYMMKKHILPEYKKIDYQTEFFDQIYGRDCLLTAIEKINLGNSPDARLSFLLLLKYINNQNPVLLKNLQYPVNINFEEHLNLDYNTAEQLNIIGDSKYDKFCILSLMNFTSTNMGKRMLKRRVMSPYANVEKIQEMYDLIEEMIGKNNYTEFEKYLDELPDITKKHKKIYFESITPMELYDLNESYKFILNLLELKNKNPKLKKYLDDNFNLNHLEILDYKKWYNDIFNEDAVMRCRDIQEISSNIFKEDYDEELRECMKSLKEVDNYRDVFRDIVDTFLSSHLKKYGTRYEKNYLYVTKTKLNILKKFATDLKIGDLQLIHKVLNKKDYITTEKLNEMNRKESKNLDKLRTRTEKLYNEYIQTLSKHKCFYEKLDEVSGMIDYIKSGVKCAIINNYVKPEIDYKEEESYFDVKDFRHPIIEKINREIPFISNSMRLDKKTKGLVLSGINGIGKSSCLKNIGILLIMAQAGYYVPCRSMIYSPFNSILTRIKGNDNIYTNSSSYTVEIQELSNILRKANSKSLILIDELCRGTEHLSSHALTISIIKHLINDKKSRFILTSHMHSIFENKDIQNLWKTKEISIQHMSIDIKQGEIIYLRKLVDGPSDTKYGLEIARNLGIDEALIGDAIKIRNDYLGKTNEILPTKNSLYNKDLFMKQCEICGSQERLETHHIREQNEADQSGYILDGNFHKNDKHNLSVLCKECHKRITFGKIKMTQRVMTTKGPKVQILNLEKDNIDNDKTAKLISDLRVKKISWKSIPMMLKNNYNIELSSYKCKKIFEKYIK